MDEAIKLAKQLAEKNNTHRMAKLVLALADAKAGQFPQAAENFAGSAVGVMGELTSALSRAWMMAAQGEHKAAVDLLDGLKQVATQDDRVTNVRGRGLLCAFDLPNQDLRDRFKKASLEKGLLVLGAGQRSVRLRPPLSVKKPEIDHGLSLILDVVKSTK